MLSRLFMQMLEISITTSIAIVILLLSSSFINKRFISKWKYWIWLVLAVRLVIPVHFTLPEAPVQLVIPEAPVFQGPLFDSGNTDLITKTPEENSPRPSPPLPEQPPITPVATSVQPLATPKLQDTSVKLPELLAWIWLAGMVLFMAYHLAGYFLFKKQLFRKGRPDESARIQQLYSRVAAELYVNQPVSIYLMNGIRSPMMLGFTKPYLLIPNYSYSDTALYYIIKHELTHLKRRDAWYKLLIVAANAVHWFNPLVYRMRSAASRDLEISCDDAVMRKADVKDRKQYTEVIMHHLHETQKRRHTALSTDFDGGVKMMKERFYHILSTRRKRRGVAGFLGLLLLTAVIGTMIGCSGGGTKPVAAGESKYVNNDLGFSLVIPESWETKYTTSLTPTGDPDSVQFNYKKGGILLTLTRMEGDHILLEELPGGPPMHIAMQGHGYTFLAVYPSDVQAPVEAGEAAVKEYQAMFADREKLLRSIELQPDKRPVAKKEQYQVVGTGYFKVELPEQWSVERAEQELIWELKENGEYRGQIEEMVWDGKTDTATDEFVRFRSMIQDHRKIGVTMSSDAVDEAAFDYISDSLEFRPGASSVVDLQSRAQQYLNAGGKRLFGKVQGFNMENGAPVSVNIKLMDFIPDADNIAEPSPNGFRIEDRNETRTFPILSHSEVAPLIAPQYTHYGAYTVINLDQWVDESGKLRAEHAASALALEDSYYHFILHGGTIKIMLGHYIP